jgi:hypothetical protein
MRRSERWHFKAGWISVPENIFEIAYRKFEIDAPALLEPSKVLHHCGGRVLPLGDEPG